MSEFKGTPGPWWTDGEYINDECGIAIIAANTHCGPLPGNPTRGMVAWASEIVEKNAQRCQADARLIAACPTMYEYIERKAATGDNEAAQILEKINASF